MRYFFRGVVVFDYDANTKQMEVPDDDTGGNFNYCKFIPDDYKLIAEFFNTAHQHAIGEIPTEDLKDIEVN